MKLYLLVLATILGLATGQLNLTAHANVVPNQTAPIALENFPPKSENQASGRFTNSDRIKSAVYQGFKYAFAGSAAGSIIGGGLGSAVPGPGNIVGFTAGAFIGGAGGFALGFWSGFGRPEARWATGTTTHKTTKTEINHITGEVSTTVTIEIRDAKTGKVKSTEVRSSKKKIDSSSDESSKSEVEFAPGSESLKRNAQ